MTIRDNKVSSLYRELEPAEPPSALDQAIIAAARREISGNKTNIKRLSRWTLPLSAAAVLVIGVSTLMMIQEREPQTLRPPSDSTVPYMTSPSSSAKDTTRSADDISTSPQSKSYIPTPEHAKKFEERRQEQESIRRKLEDEAYRQIKATEAERRLELEPKRLAEERKLRDDTILNKQKKPHNEIGSVNDFAPTPDTETGFGGTNSPPQLIPNTINDATLSDGKAPLTESPTTASRPAAEAWLKKIAQLKRDGKTQEAATELIAFKHVYPNFPATQREELLKQFEHESK